MLIFAIWLTLIRTVVFQRSWYQMPRCSVQCKMNKNTHGYMTVWYTKNIYVSFGGHSSSSQEFVTFGINLGTVWLLFYYWTSKLINVLLFPSYPIHIIYALIFPIIRDPGPRYKWVGKSLTSNKQVGFKAFCSKQVGFEAFVISKSFSSLLIGYVRRPTPPHRQREFEYNW